MAHDLGGHALAHLALGLWIDRQGEIGMRLDVDEARRNYQAAGINDFCGCAGQIRTDAGNTAVADGDVGTFGCGCAAIEQ
jgi:hypothetical protein